MKLLLIGLLAFQVTATDYKLTEVELLRVENIKLKSQVIQLNQKLIEAQLAPLTNEFNSQVNQLIEELRVKMKAGKDDVFNWDTLKFDPKENKDEVKK